MFNVFKKKKKEPESLKEVLDRFVKIEKEFKVVAEELEKIKSENLSNIQAIGVVRFNPFSDTGGDQSFSVALLDGKDNGVVVTSLYTREGNRVYGKPIKAGLSSYSLSEEEKKAIQEAKKSKTNDR